MKWNQIFNRGKRVAQAEATGSLHSLLLPSLLGIAVCLLTLCSLTWAWFTAQVHTDTTTIQSAYIHVYAASSADAFVPAGAATQDAEGDAVMMAYAVPVNPEPSASSTETTTLEPTKLTIGSDGKFYFVAQGTAKKAYLKIKDSNSNEYFTTTLAPTDPDAKDDNGTVITPVLYTVYEVNLGSEISGNITLSLCWGDNTNVPNLIEPTPVKDGESNRTITTWPGDGGAAKIMTSLWITEEEEETEQNTIVSEEKKPKEEAPEEEPEQMTEEKKEETKTEEKKPQENEQEEPKQEEKPKVETQDGISDDNQSDKESESNVPGGTGSIT